MSPPDPTVISAVGVRFSRQTLWQRIPWVWSDFVARSRVPLWLLSFSISALLFGMSFLVALVYGELPKFLGNVLWLTYLLVMSPIVFMLGRAPTYLDRIWESLQPWVKNPEEEILAAKAAAPSLVMRGFWPVALILGLAMLLFGLVDAQVGWQGFQSPETVFLLYLVAAPFVAYFGGGVISLAVIGLGLLGQSISRLDLKRGFILGGGKGVLQPFNQLLWLVWVAYIVPLVAITVLSIGTLLTRLLLERASQFELILLYVQYILITIIVAVPSIFVPQFFMNRFLAREKAEELHALQQELAEAVSLPEPADAAEILRRVLRHQHLVYQIQQVQSFNPTLVDARFVIQIALSITAIILANILLEATGLR